MKSRFYVFFMFVRASWGPLTKPYIIPMKYNALGGRDPPRGAFSVIVADFTKMSEHFVKLAKLHEFS